MAASQLFYFVSIMIMMNELDPADSCLMNVFLLPYTVISVKGRWKRETTGVGREEVFE